MKLKNVKTERKNSKINDLQVNSIIVKSSLKKNSFLEIQRNSKIEKYTDYKSNYKGRKDSRGVPIIKGNKNHKLSFADTLYGSNLAVIINIESFKEYNALEVEIAPDDENLTNKKKDSNCRCQIL